MTNNQSRIVIDHTGNQRGKGVKDCLISYGQRINFELLIFSLTLSMQISVSIDSDRTRNGQPPQILGAIGHPRYNGISELTDFVITGLHCILFLCLFVQGFIATLTAMVMAISDTHMFPGFLIPVLTQLSFQSHRQFFSYA